MRSLQCKSKQQDFTSRLANHDWTSLSIIFLYNTDNVSHVGYNSKVFTFTIQSPEWKHSDFRMNTSQWCYSVRWAASILKGLHALCTGVLSTAKKSITHMQKAKCLCRPSTRHGGAKLAHNSWCLRSIFVYQILMPQGDKNTNTEARHSKQDRMSIKTVLVTVKKITSRWLWLSSIFDAKCWSQSNRTPMRMKVVNERQKRKHIIETVDELRKKGDIAKICGLESTV